MKYLMTAMICLCMLLCIPNAAAENRKKWSDGDIIQVGVLCKDEDTILEIVNADIKSEKDALLQMNESLMKGVCIGFPMPAMFLVIKALVHYKDHRGRPSVVLGIGNADRAFVGWALGHGEYVKSKKGNSI